MKFSKEKKFEKYIGKEIIYFLKNKGLYNLYCFNLEKYLNNKVKDYPDNMVNIPFTIGSFVWRNSEEGHTFWYNIQEETNHLGLMYECKTEFIKDLL